MAAIHGGDGEVGADFIAGQGRRSAGHENLPAALVKRASNEAPWGDARTMNLPELAGTR